MESEIVKPKKSLRHAAPSRHSSDEGHHASSLHHNTSINTTMRSSYLARASLWILLLTLALESSHGWLIAPAAAMIQQTAAAVMLTANLLLGSPSPQEQAMLGKELQSQLQAPTDDRPQIQIPSNQQSSGASVDKDTPIVEGTSS
jgi:hypothetical protein